MKKLLILILYFNLTASVPMIASDPLRIPDDLHDVRLKSVGHPDSLAVIDVLVVYTQAAESWASTRGGIDTIIAQGFRLSNIVMQNSGTGVRVELVHKMKTSYVETSNSTDDLRRVTFGKTPWDTITYMQDVRDAREQYGADLVILVPAVGNAAGLAWQLRAEEGRPAYGYSLVMIHYFNQLTKVHEIGHNMGAHHHAEQLSSPGPGLYPYSAGWRWFHNNEAYVSVMTYPSGSSWADRLGGRRVAYFSSPRVPFFGVPTGDSLSADNARTIIQMKHTIAAYRNRPEPQLTLPTVYVKLNEVTHQTASFSITAEGDSLLGSGLHWGPDTVSYIVSEGAEVSLEYLWPEYNYFYRGYATNPVGQAVSSWSVFKTKDVPTITPPVVNPEANIYPNPSTGVVIIDYPGRFHLRVTRMNGRVYTIVPLSVDRLSVFMKDRGMYVFEITDLDNSYSVRRKVRISK